MLEPRYGRSQAPLDPSNNPIYTHSRTRTTSSNTFPDQMQAQQHQQHQPPPGYPTPMNMHLVTPQGAHQRRSPSVNTFSTVSSAGGGMQPPPAYRTSPTADLRRSTSGRSGSGGGGAPPSPLANGYIALLRKQKATAWCDRTQYDDPRLQAQQRAAKMRANLNVVGGAASGGSGSGLGLSSSGASGGRTSTGLSSAGGKVAAKIRHHGKPAVVGYAPDSRYVGVAGVPLRLSATEVEGEDSDEDDVTMQRLHHRRTGSSGRSSTASGRRALAYRSSGGLGPINQGSNSSGGGGGKRWSPGDTPERTGSLVGGKEELTLAGDNASDKARSVGSGSSKERFDSVPDLGGNPQRPLAGNSKLNSAIAREKSVKNPEDLKRRGSVDERTMTLTSGRLFIANPD